MSVNLKHRGPDIRGRKKDGSMSRNFSEEARATKFVKRKGKFNINSDDLDSKVQDFLSNGGKIKMLTEAGKEILVN